MIFDQIFEYHGTTELTHKLILTTILLWKTRKAEF